MTFDHEHVPTEHLHALEQAGHRVAPGPPRWSTRRTSSSCAAALRAGRTAARLGRGVDATGTSPSPTAHGWPVVLKTPRGGYDGKGVFVVDGPDEAAGLLEQHGTLLPRSGWRSCASSPPRWPARRSGRSRSGRSSRPCSVDGVCSEVLAPAPGLAEELATAAQELAVRIADRLGVVGMLAVELFETADGVLVNELAMRPHNSGHWTIEGARTSQFEQHLRAVLDYPLGATR